MTARLRNAADTIDVQVERIARLIETGAGFDRELAAGHGCRVPMSSVQSDIDVALTYVDKLQKAVREALSQEKSRRRRGSS